MTRLYKLVRNQKTFIILTSSFLASASVLVLSVSKSEIHLAFNSMHFNAADYFFKLITNLGDGLFVVIVGLLFLLFRIRYSFLIIGSCLLSGLVVQFLKRVFFSDVARPIEYFRDISQLHLVDGVKMAHWHSFPSGHSTSAFALFFCFAIIINNKKAQWICFMLAFITAFSRVYLSQHFLIDIAAGAIIGTISTLLCQNILLGINKKWMDMSIIMRRR